jgi:hypothetical protein
VPAITLSTGDIVHFKDRYTHAMHKAVFAAVNEGVIWQQDAVSGEYKKDIPPGNIEFQYDAVYPLAILKIVKDGKELVYSEEWLNDLPQEDVGKLETAMTALRRGGKSNEEKEEERKKNR